MQNPAKFALATIAAKRSTIRTRRGIIVAVKGFFVGLAVFLSSAKCIGQGTMLFEADHPHFGSKSLTVDSRTGLTFLDVTKSLDMSLRQVRQEMLPGGDFFGFRHASPQEVTSLYLTAGFSPSTVPVNSSQFGSVLRLIGLIGETHEVRGYPATHAIMNDQTSTFIHYSGFPPGYFVLDPSTKSIIYENLDYSDPSLGHWLVVPEPSTFSLLTVVFVVFGIRSLIRRSDND